MNSLFVSFDKSKLILMKIIILLFGATCRNYNAQPGVIIKIITKLRALVIYSEVPCGIKKFFKLSTLVFKSHFQFVKIRKQRLGLNTDQHLMK